ncbi:hypothetical protein [Croceimicrobium sp.]|uniref:hypothetical protein n=1 Tax=Croceimicrobium sp. TaxID=2828340 RepID=UPI003BABBDF6
MVTIYSRKDEGSVDRVLDWLHFADVPFKRIFPESFTESGEGAIPRSYGIQGHSRAGERKDTYWLRNWSKLRFEPNPVLPGLEKNMEADLLAVFDLEAYQGQLGSIYRSVEKPRQLNYALQHGLQIPETLISNNREDLRKFIEQQGTVITKPLAHPYTFYDPEGIQKPKLSYTRTISLEEVEGLPKVFHFSLFQKLVEKQYEIRTFYLNGTCWSMAIFSQSSEQTKVDFRNYNLKNRNRSIPFQLPREMENRIRSFMKACDLNWGSLDFAVDANNDFIFFEVNPQGQFGMVSNPCNYHLEKELAEFIAANNLY